MNCQSLITFCGATAAGMTQETDLERLLVSALAGAMILALQWLLAVLKRRR